MRRLQQWYETVECAGIMRTTVVPTVSVVTKHRSSASLFLEKDLEPCSIVVLLRTSDVQLGAVHRAAPGIWCWTALTPQKMLLASHLGVSLLSRVSVVPCVLARTSVSMS